MWDSPNLSCSRELRRASILPSQLYLWSFDVTPKCTRTLGMEALRSNMKSMHRTARIHKSCRGMQTIKITRQSKISRGGIQQASTVCKCNSESQSPVGRMERRMFYNYAKSQRASCTKCLECRKKQIVGKVTKYDTVGFLMGIFYPYIWASQTF